MRILALEPYYGGSHQAFLDGWIAHSQHEWTVVTLPAYHWKWRMRHAAITMARQLKEPPYQESRWDIVFCSDMLNLPEFRGLAPAHVAGLKTILYFHENQLTYPSQQPREWDYHFSFTNFTSAIAADRIWFNTKFHRDEMFSALVDFLQRMPDHQPLNEIEALKEKAGVQYPGIDLIEPLSSRPAGLPRITWAARWEHDKDPDLFFQAIYRLKEQGFKFRLNVLGQSFRNSPDVFQVAREELADEIDQWGYLEQIDDYRTALRETDIFVSTAQHEFFGIAAVEAISAGAYPLLPDRLSYPELLQRQTKKDRDHYFYAGDLSSLVTRLGELIEQTAQDDSTLKPDKTLSHEMQRFGWSVRAPEMDQEIEALYHH